MAAIFGVSPRWLVGVEDPVEMIVIEAIIDKAIALQEQRDRNLATLIGNEIGKRLG